MPHAMSHAAPLRTFTVLTFAVCLIVVVLGSYVRLSDAGLGCPTARLLRPSVAGRSAG